MAAPTLYKTTEKIAKLLDEATEHATKGYHDLKKAKLDQADRLLALLPYLEKV